MAQCPLCGCDVEFTLPSFLGGRRPVNERVSGEVIERCPRCTTKIVGEYVVFPLAERSIVARQVELGKPGRCDCQVEGLVLATLSFHLKPCDVFEPSHLAPVRTLQPRLHCLLPSPHTNHTTHLVKCLACCPDTLRSLCSSPWVAVDGFSFNDTCVTLWMRCAVHRTH